VHSWPHRGEEAVREEAELGLGCYLDGDAQGPWLSWWGAVCG
jgi:hypothetical protein